MCADRRKMKTIDRISVLITAYKNAELVKQCVDSLRAAFGGTLPEVVIVDDAAGDVPTRELAESYAAEGVKFAVMPENGGFAGANNFGYPLCTREFVALVNTDIVFREEPFTALVEFMDAHPQAGVAQGTVIVRNGQPGADGRLNGCGSFLTPLGNNTCLGWLAPADDLVGSEARKCFAAYGAMFMIRRGVVESVPCGLFHGFFHTYYEEVNFCHRAWLAGWEVWYVPTPPVDHAHGATMERFYAREDVLKRFYRNIRFSYRTCFGWRGRLTVAPMFELCAMAQAALQLLRGNGTAFRAHRWALRDLRRLRGEAVTVRKAVQSARKVSDTELFRVVMRRRTWREFWDTVRSNV